MSFRFSIVVSRDHIIDSIPYGHVSVGYTICDHTVNGERFTLGFAELNFRCFRGLLAYRDREYLGRAPHIRKVCEFCLSVGPYVHNTTIYEHCTNLRSTFNC